MYYRIDPVDSWFFRNGAPYDAGVNSYGESIFPPFPSVYAGMFRNFESEKTDEIKFAKRLKIGWNGILVDDNMLFPLPLDLAIDSLNLFGTEKILKKAVGGGFPLHFYLMPQGESKKAPHISGGAYINNVDMSNYINGKSSEYHVHALGNYFNMENRIGISIDSSSKIAESGKIYEQVFIVPDTQKETRKVGLAVETQGVEISEKAIVRIGGEGKLGVVSKADLSLPIPPPSMLGDNHFKLYLATPAIFEKGWIPGWINKDTMEGCFTHKKHRIRLKLISAVVSKPVFVGGFGYDKNLKKPRPKELRYAVPAGSVYFFQILEGGKEDVVYLFHNRCISDYRESIGFTYENGKLNPRIKQAYSRLRYCSRGFGYCLVCAISQNQRGGLF